MAKRPAKKLRRWEIIAIRKRGEHVGYVSAESAKDAIHPMEIPGWCVWPKPGRPHLSRAATMYAARLGNYRRGKYARRAGEI